MKFSETPRLAFGRKPEPDAEKTDDVPTAKLAKLRARRSIMLAEAATVLTALPEPGESLHALMTGRYDLTHLLLVILGRLGKCQRLRIATLAFSDQNTQELCGLLDNGRIAELGILCSLFFKNNRQAAYAAALKEMLARGQKLAACRNHAKVVTIGLADGRKFSLEGSANMRSNSNWEQFCLVNDAGLHDWHAAWIDEAITKHGEIHQG